MMGHPSDYRIKIRCRAPLPKPWKWEIHGDRLIASGHESYASRAAANEAGQAALAEMIAKHKKDGEISN